MKLRLGTLVFGTLLGAGACNNVVGVYSGDPGTGGGSGSGNNAGTGDSAGGGNASGAGNATGKGGSGMVIPTVPGELDLTGSPAYLHMVRLTNAQWARAVQDILKLT